MIGPPGTQGPQGVPGPQGPQGPPGRGIEISLTDFLALDLDLGKVNDELTITTDGVVHIRAVTGNVGGVGTGFVFHVEDQMAYVLTARHVLHGGGNIAETFTVCVTAVRCVDAELVYFPGRARDGRLSDQEGADLASLRFPCAECKPLAINPNQDFLVDCTAATCWYFPEGLRLAAITYRSLEEGAQVLSGESFRSRMHVLSIGEVAHDIYLLPGTSGSPLLNEEGYVVGVNLGFTDQGNAIARYLDQTDQRIRNILRRAVDGN